MSNLYDKLIEYGNSDYYGFHMPGHKRNFEYTHIDNPYKYDITEIEGFDNLHHPTEIIKEEMENAAAFFGANYTRFLVNGSSCGILAAISAVTEKKKKIVIARNSHKSVYNALFIGGLEPIYIYPDLVKDFGINGSCNPNAIENILCENNDVAAVVITSPTYEGVVSDIKKISEITHKYEVPLIVDQAHGAHFGLDEYFPVSAVKLGADIVITSLHKTLMSMTQTALIHIKSEFVDYKTVDKYLRIYQSSSPSYVLMGSISNCIHILQSKGNTIFERYIQRLEKFFANCSNLKNIHVITKDEMLNAGAVDYDRSKIIIRAKNAGGRRLYDRLLDVYHLQMEMAASDYIIAMTSPADTDEGFSRLAVALHEIDEWLNEIHNLDKMYNLNEIRHANIKMTVKDAMIAETESVKIEESVGRVSAEFVYLYPPGIPLIAPGEEITEGLIKDIYSYKSQGLNVQGTEDYTVNSIKVNK